MNFGCDEFCTEDDGLTRLVVTFCDLSHLVPGFLFFKRTPLMCPFVKVAKRGRRVS